jgi:DNA-binding beta-propeller fold protein YncE
MRETGGRTRPPADRPPPVRRGRLRWWVGGSVVGAGAVAPAVILTLQAIAVTPVGTQIPIGALPNSLAAAGGSLYADFGGGRTVTPTPVSIATGKPGTPIPVGSGPVALAVVGRVLYVANHGSGTVTKFELG